MEQDINQTSQTPGTQFPEDSVDNQIFEVNEQQENIAVQQSQEIKQLPQVEEVKEIASGETIVSEQKTENQEKINDGEDEYDEESQKHKYKLLFAQFFNLAKIILPAAVWKTRETETLTSSPTLCCPSSTTIMVPSAR